MNGDKDAASSSSWCSLFCGLLLQECIALMEEGAVSCLDNGDHVYAAFNLAFAILFEYHRGLPLHDLNSKIDRAVKTLRHIGDKQHLSLVVSVRHIIR